MGSMTNFHWIWLIIFGAAYVAFLFLLAARARKINVKDDGGEDFDFARAGSNNRFLIFLSFSATLFSTFTLMGVPDFFRVHGVATWVFIGVTDVTLGLVVLWFGYKYFQSLRQHKVNSMTEILALRFKRNWGVSVYLIGIFVFLLPYVAIQIQGVSELASALILPGVGNSWASYVIASLVLVIIYLYSTTGGLRAIMFSDVVQGLILTGIIYLIAVTILDSFGGLQQFFVHLEASNHALMVPPGPTGFMSWQYLLASFIAILWMPVTQPQLTSRIASMTRLTDLPIISVGISVFAFLILLPTIVIGLSGAMSYPEATSGEFLAQTLVLSQAGWVGALAIVGLLAAAMSTADSQFFALRTEIQQSTGAHNQYRQLLRRVLFPVFFILALLLAIFVREELIPLARVSFAGTALLGPMIVAALFRKRGSLSGAIPAITLLALAYFLLSQFGAVPSKIVGMRLDLSLMIITSFVTIVFFILERPGKRSVGGV